MSRKKYQTECDADFPDVLLIDRAKRDREGRSGRDEDAEAETQKEDPGPGPHGGEVDCEDHGEEQQVDEPELESPRRSGHRRRPVLLLQNARIESGIPPAKRTVEH